MSTEQAGQGPGKAEEQAGKSAGTIPGPDIIAYNLRREERPGGIESPVPVAFLGRTSNERLQNPVASMRRQVRNSRAWLPPGCQIVAYYWDVESGGDDLEDRGHGDAWQIAAATGIPRDGGIADLLNEAASPTPNFASWTARTSSAAPGTPTTH